MKSEKAKAAIERFRQEFAGIYDSDEVTEFCRLFGEISEIAEQEAEERLARWNDPKEKLPSDNRWVLARVNCEVAPYRIARYFEEEKHVRAYWYVLNNPEASAGFVLAWREIHQ